MTTKIVLEKPEWISVIRVPAEARRHSVNRDEALVDNEIDDIEDV